MKKAGTEHNIEGAFVLVLFAVFAITVIAVLALGANSYKSLVERDNDAYNKRIITSYVTAKIRASDGLKGVEVGGFTNPEVDDGVNTLHLYRTIDGDRYDQRVYFYDGKVCEMLTIAGSNIEPDAGNEILDAEELTFEMDGSLINIHATDTEHRENHTAVSVRSLLAGTEENTEDAESVGGVG